MKPFDSLYGVKKEIPQIPQTISKSPKNWYYFYKSLRIVMSVWIVVVTVIIGQPWLDYWVKSAINHKNNSQVLGDSVPISSPTPKPLPIGGVGTFYFKNSKIEIEAPIIEGIEEDSLSKGVGHHPESAWPNEKGNVVLAGHNTDLNPENPYSRVFFKLRDVSIGDEVIINFQGQNYYYKVFKSQTVSPKDTSLFGQLDDWILTFYTCDPPYTDWKRLVYQAKLFKIE